MNKELLFFLENIMVIYFFNFFKKIFKINEIGIRIKF